MLRHLLWGAFAMIARDVAAADGSSHEWRGRWSERELERGLGAGLGG